MEGDVFLGANGELLTLVDLERVECPDGITVYNFTVDGNHNYFVIAACDEFGQTSILVHNAEGYGGWQAWAKTWLRRLFIGGSAVSTASDANEAGKRVETLKEQYEWIKNVSEDPLGIHPDPPEINPKRMTWPLTAPHYRP